MNPIHNSTQFIGICNGTSFHQATNIVGKDEIEDGKRKQQISEDTYGFPVVISPSLQKTDHQRFFALPINSGPLKNDAAPIMETSLSPSFSRLHQRVVFNFLTGNGEVEKLPCSEISENQELHGLSQAISFLEKKPQEEIPVPDQKSIFNFLNGDVFQHLVFLLDFHFASNFGWDTCGDLGRCLSQLDLENSRDKSAYLDNTSHSMQDNGSTSTVSHKLQLTDYYSTEHLITDPRVKMNGFTEVNDENIHSECSFLASNPFSDSPLHYYQKTFKGVNASDFISLESNRSYLIENLSGMLSKSNCGAEVFEQTTTTYQENLLDFSQHSTNGNSVESTFAIPDPDELLEYLHGDLTSPKFLASDPSNEESDNLDFSLHLGYCSSDEVAKSDKLSGSITNPCGETLGIDIEYGMFETLGYAIGSEIGAMTGALGEIETPANPSLPDPSQIERIRWNWSIRDVDFSHFHFDDHEDLLELYGLNEQDVQVDDDEFCDSPTWPGKRFIQESDLEYLVAISASVKETDSSSEIAGPTTTTRSTNENCSGSYMDSPRDYHCKIVSQVHEKRLENSVSRIYYHQSFDNVPDTLPGNYINTTYQYRNTASLNASGTSGHSFGYFQEYLAIGSDEELTFTIPDPDELMEFLHGCLNSPKFLASDPSNGEADNYHFSSNFEICSSDEVAKSDNLSDFIANVASKYGKNVNEDGVLGLFGLANGYEIGAMTGAFGKTETPDPPSLPEQSQVEKVRWNWANRDVDSSCFNFGDHEELLELYGLKQQDVQANDDEFCDSPTWPGKE